MKKSRIIGMFIILIGIGIAAYPISLRVKGNADQKMLKEEFVRKKEAITKEAITKEAITKETLTKETSNKSESKIELEKIMYDDWPDTLMKIPKIDVEAIVVEMEASNIDVFAANANYPPAHYRTTDYPGGESNVGIAAHRTGPADYFRHLDKLEEGDRITLETSKDEHEYKVERVFIVHPSDNSVIMGTDYGALTLTSCEREDGISNKKRIIVRAKLVDQNDKGDG